MTDIRWHKLQVIVTQAAIVGALLLVWQWAPDWLLEEVLWSRPSTIAAQFAVWIKDGTLLQQSVATLTTVAVGMLLGGIFGIVLGLLAGSSRMIEQLAVGPVEALFALPKITLVPLFILWMGIGAVQHVVFTALVVFFFFFFAVHSGVRSVPVALNDTLTLGGASPAQRVRLLYLPASFGWIIIAMRLAMPYAFVAAASTEIVASTVGLGHLIKASATVMNSAGMFAGMLMLLIVSLAASAGANALAARSRWVLN